MAQRDRAYPICIPGPCLTPELLVDPCECLHNHTRAAQVLASASNVPMYRCHRQSICMVHRVWCMGGGLTCASLVRGKKCSDSITSRGSDLRRRPSGVKYFHPDTTEARTRITKETKVPP
jgi:hypothetical protein